MADVRLILASASPRRSDLLSAAGFTFEVLSADIDETPLPEELPLAFAARMSLEKATEVARTLTALTEPTLVLGADTIVVLDNDILGKPTDEADAISTLHRLSARTHEVITAVSVLRVEPSHYGNDRASFVGRTDHASTRVTFRAIDHAEIAAYVATGEPLDKAGSYGIQGGAAVFVDDIDGPYDNIVGLPLDVVRTLLHPSSKNRHAVTFEIGEGR